MKYPKRVTHVMIELVGDGLSVFDSQRNKYQVLNPTVALVWQQCNGQTSTDNLTRSLQQKFNLPQAEADKLMWLALEELEKTNLLIKGTVTEAPTRYNRRQIIKGFAAVGLSVALLPLIVEPQVVQAQTAPPVAVGGVAEYIEPENNTPQAIMEEQSSRVATVGAVSTVVAAGAGGLWLARQRNKPTETEDHSPTESED
jgi:hypothetical protein